MQLLEDVYQNYPITLSSGARVPSRSAAVDLVSLRTGLPELLTALVASIRPNRSFRVYGGVGQTNYNFAKIPWVAVCDERVTTSTQKGFYIVLLFREAMDGFYLSLNQGFTQFTKAFGAGRQAEARISQSSTRCLSLLDVKPGYVRGEIDLGAKLPMGRGYERGAIVSKLFQRSAEFGLDDLTIALAHLLDLNDRLFERIGPDLTVNADPLSEGEFQVAVGARARSSRKLKTPPPGPQKRPRKGRGRGRGLGGYRRDPDISALAQRRAAFRCEVNADHETFTSSASKANFVECHHLLPMSLQDEFEFSLDVVENVVAVCPNCHRLLHHGLPATKRPILRALFNTRESSLRRKGLRPTLEALLLAYRTNLSDND